MLQLALDGAVADDAAGFGPWDGYRIPEDRGAWHPLAARLYQYWLSVMPNGRLPGRQHIVPEELAPLWSRLFMLDVFHPPLRFRYRLCGTEMVRSLGGEVTGRWLDDVHPQLVADLESRERFRYMVETGAATWRHGPPLWTRDPDHRMIETCVVPLAANGHDVDKVLGVAVVYDSSGRAI